MSNVGKIWLFMQIDANAQEINVRVNEAFTNIMSVQHCFHIKDKLS